MLESSAVATKKKFSIVKGVKSQPFTTGFALTFASWAAEQALPGLLGSWWAKMPFLEIAAAFALISIGKNYEGFLAWIKDKSDPLSLTAVRATANYQRRVDLELKFHKNFKNAKVIVELYDLTCMLGGPCQFMKRATIKKPVPEDINRGDEISTELVWYNQREQDAPEEGNPLCLNRGQNISMEFQLRAVVSVTSSNKKIVKREVDIFLPAGSNTSFMISVMGKHCQNGQVMTDTKTRFYKELVDADT